MSRVSLFVFALAVTLILAACGAEESENCTCHKVYPHISTCALENLTPGDICGTAADGDVEKLDYVLDHFKDDILDSQWNRALGGALNMGHVDIAEKLWDEYDKYYEKFDWDDALRSALSYGGYCSSVRFIFKHAKDKITEKDLLSRALCSHQDCKVQACIDYGYCDGQNLLIDLVAGFPEGHGKFTPKVEGYVPGALEKMLERLLDSGYKPSKEDMIFVKEQYNGPEKEQLLKMLE